MNQCANVSICQPVCTHGATDWHISRMRLFIVLSRFSHRRLLSCVKRVGYLRKSLYKSGRNATGSRIRICYRFQWFAFWCAVGLPGFLPVSFPVVYRHTIEVFEKSAESSGRISSQMRKFFHVLHLAVILHDEIVETFRISADRIEEWTQLG